MLYIFHRKNGDIAFCLSNKILYIDFMRYSKQLFFRYVPTVVTTQKCEPYVRENCSMIMKTVCNEVCKEECEVKDKKVCMTIPHQECRETSQQVCKDIPRSECKKVTVFYYLGFIHRSLSFYKFSFTVFYIHSFMNYKI